MAILDKSKYPDMYDIKRNGQLFGKCSYNYSGLIDNGFHEFNTKLDTSNIYTVIDRTKYNLPGFGYTKVTVNGTNADDASITFEVNNQDLVNARLMLRIRSDIAAYSSDYAPIKASGIDTSEDIYIFTDSNNPYTKNVELVEYENERFYTQVNNITSAVNNPAYSYIFVNDLDKSKIVIRINGFAFYKNGYVSEVKYSDIKPQDNSPAGSNYSKDIWENNYNETYGYCLGFTGITFNVYDNNGKLVGGLPSFDSIDLDYSNLASDLYLLIQLETFIDGGAYYYYNDALNMLGVKTGKWNYSFVLDFEFNLYKNEDYRNSNFSQFISFNPSYHGSALTKSDTLGNREYYAFFNMRETVTLQNSSQETYFYYNVERPDRTISYYDGEVYNFNYSPQEIMRFLALYLIPFTFDIVNDISNGYGETVYCGIRDERGYACGDYVQGKDIKIDDYIPEDLEPYDPDNLPETEITPEDKGDIPIGNYPPDIVNSFTKFYLMNAIAVDSLGDDLWSKMLSYDANINSNMVDNFFLSKFIQQAVDASNYDINFTLSNVVDYFISLRYYPIPNMQDYIRGAEVHSIKVGTGSLPIQIEKGVCLKPLNFFATIDGGRIYLDEIKKDLYGSFADYEPNVSVSLYVPYLGTYSLQPSTIFDNNMQYIDITYGVDITSGQMVAILYKNGSANFPLCCLQGTIGFDIPISGSTYNSTMTAAKINGQNFFRDKSFDVLGSLFTLGGGLLNNSQSSFLGASQRNTSVINDVANYVNGYPLVTGTRPIMVGTADSLAACLQPQVAYIQVIRHSTSNGKAFPDKYGDTYGFNSYKNSTIGSQTGFIKCANPRLDGIPCNEYERDEIYNLLTSGVYWQ